MKLRIKGNSIRLRLSRSEVNQFCKEGYLEEKTEFRTSDFVYALQSKVGIPNLTANFSEGKITMYVPVDIQKVWADNETISYDSKMDLGNDDHLYLLLEKDFKCIDAQPNEDQSDNFENPRKVC